MRFIDADELKRHLRWDYRIKIGFQIENMQDEFKKLDAIIDGMKELKPLERDNGAEPVLENHTSTWHENYGNGQGAFKSKQSLEWKCPNCGWFVGELYCGFGKWHIQRETSYCASCGQKIGWKKAKEEEKRRYEEQKKKEREEHLKRTGIPLDNMYEGLRRKHGKLSEEEQNADIAD